MTPCVASVSRTIPVISWHNHNQTSFPSKNILFIWNINEISTVVNFNESLEANIQHRTDSLRIAGLLEIPATCRYMQAASSWVERCSWQLVRVFWLEANYSFLRTSHFFWLSSSSPFPHQQGLPTETPQTGESGSESGEMTGGSSYASLAGTQRPRRHQCVHREAANVVIKNMTQNAHWQVVHKTGSSTTKMQHAIGCEYVHIMVYGCQLIE